ncbi:non-canonical purine NTP pyrophosphatase [Silvibacterium acidisoli]|uniref:non-canonical purine NTP pyrophosphatase n=1 Tax=Acidobacteriaceae bacterium ZG23-2 TaxID=2883246 RepID=UPI00406CF9FD
MATNKLLYIATSNPGKLRDFAWAAQSINADVRLEPLPGLREITAPPEDEPSFMGNARTKAEYYSSFAPGEIVLADDSGLEVDALGGDPGVRSARFADDAAFAAHLPTDERNNCYLLERLKTVGPAPFAARYHCALVAAVDGRLVHSADGAVEGEIVSTPRGTAGFGYDPLFYLPQEKKTMAEIDPDTRLRLSHRGQALRNLLALL